MKTVITDLSSSQKEKLVIIVPTNPTSALRFSLSYHLQPHGYLNGIGEVEVTAEHMPTHERATHATLVPSDETILALGSVLRYFQYAKNHLSTQKGPPISYAKWLKKQN